MSFVSCLLMGQGDNQLNEMLTESLRSHIKHDSDFHAKFIKNSKESKPRICRDGLPANFPFDGIQNATFFSLWNLSGLHKSFHKELKKGISAYFVDIKLAGNQFIITIHNNGVKLIKDNHIGISIAAWGIFTFEYSSEKQKWLLEKTEYGGV